MSMTTSDPTKLWIPNRNGGGRLIERPWLIPSKEALAAVEKLLKSVYFLVKQGDTFGERLKCVRCNGRHNYITLMCVDRPFNRTTHGLYAYYRVIKDNKLDNYLSPAERSRLQGIEDQLGMPDLSTLHPEMARKLNGGEAGPSDMLVGALSFGILEGIAPTHARKLVEKINDRGLKPKLEL